jgi:PIN domain nuclease of toxin-antitoxin system
VQQVLNDAAISTVNLAEIIGKLRTEAGVDQAGGGHWLGLAY